MIHLNQNNFAARLLALSTLMLAMVVINLCIAPTTFAVTIAVGNYSFETPDIANGVANGTIPSPWVTGGGATGQLDRNAGGPNNYDGDIAPTPDATDAEQMAYVSGSGFYQVLPTVLAANTTYTLTVDVGDAAAAFGGASLRLGTGTTFGANLLTPTVVANTTPVSNWQTWQSTFTTPAVPSQFNHPLRVEMVGTGIPLFDNVRLQDNSTGAATSVTLQNATAVFSQSGPGVGATIDGDTTPGTGWSFFPQETSNNVAVWETASDLSQSQVTFTLTHRNGFDGMNLAKLRFSVTQDNRSTFADGLATGGDVTATWTELTPLTAIAYDGGTTTINGDNTITFSSDAVADSLTDITYTVTATTPFGNITGFRLEVFANPRVAFSFGNNPTGNGTLTEFQVTAEEVASAVPEPSTWALGLIGLAGLGLVVGRKCKLRGYAII